jgi:hypothetical protein
VAGGLVSLVYILRGSWRRDVTGIRREQPAEETDDERTEE